ncbi:MAG: AHH domain-containing protein [Hyalangium sp.]|uniref:AHH domain-containing protein n=1 Tax=Hyalangium sp. TaxID=2028555 RepID=UPI00389A501B
MSEDQHAKDLEDLKDKHQKVGEACLNRHVGYYAESNTCSYRGQAYKKAKSDSQLYDWPRYEPLSKRKSGIQTAARSENRKTIPEWYKTELTPPKEGDWNVAKDGNFKDKCYTPYWHESHHIVPNSTLRAAIAAVGSGMADPSGMVLAVRGGLLDEGYNLNNKKNMIILPMDREVGLTIGLPKHRKTQDHRSHSAYSKYVRQQLVEILGKIRAASKEHEAPDYKACKEDIEKLSGHLYEAIIAAGEAMKKAATSEDSLDDMKEEAFKPAQPASPTSQGMPPETAGEL